MKKRISIVIMSLAAMLLFSACQATPEEPVVAGKSSDELIEKARTAAGEGAPAERLGAPERYQGSFSSVDGKLNVTVDAAVTIPEADSAAIIRVTDGSITQAQADVLMASLVHTPLHDPSERSKDEIMEQILEYKQMLAEGPTEEDVGFTYYDDNGNELSWEQSMQQAIDRLQEEYSAAPEENERAAISGQFVEKDGASLIEGVGYSEEYGYESFQAGNFAGLGADRALYDRNNTGNGGYILLEPTYIQYADGAGREMPELTISADDAQALTDPVVEKLGIENMTFYTARKGYEQQPERDFWVVLYTRSFNGIPITYTSATGDMMTDATVYNEPWRYETLAFFVDDSGIVGMHWESPYTVGETVTEDSALLPFEDAMYIFGRMYLAANDGAAQTVTVDQICLGYTRIAEQGRAGSGILVPAWDFFGTVTDENGNTKNDPYASLLTVNAIDGSVIDRDMGY